MPTFNNPDQRHFEPVSIAHANGYKLRFWGTPDRPGPERDVLWRALAAAGIDYINTDDLKGFSTFVPLARIACGLMGMSVSPGPDHVDGCWVQGVAT